MYGNATAKDRERFQQLCCAIERLGLPWNRLVGMTTDGAPSMTGKKQSGSAGTEKVRGKKMQIQQWVYTALYINMHCAVNA